MTAPDPSSASTPRKLSADELMWFAMAVALVVFTGLVRQKYGHFNGETNDLTIFSYAFAQTLQGKFLPLYYRPDGNLLGNHPNWIVLAWLPVYALWRSFYSLMFFQSLMLVAAAWPFYLLAKHLLRDQRAALAAGLAFLAFPTIASQHVNQIHDDQFALPFLVGAFYFFAREQFGKFLGSMVLACLAKETVPLTTAMFGIYALGLRRPLKWVLTPILFSAAYMLAAIHLLMWVFGGSGAELYTTTKYFEAYGRSPAEVLNTLLTRPAVVLQTVFSPQKLQYLAQLLLPVLYVLPFLSLAALVSLPNLLLNMVGSNIALIVIPWHYNILLGATLLCASLFSIGKLSARFKTRQQAVAVALSGAMAVLALFGTRFWYRAEEYRPLPHDAALRRAVAAVPREASVVCSSPLLAHFSQHPRITTSYSLIVDQGGPEKAANYDFVILDANWRNWEALKQQPLADWLLRSQQFELVMAQQGVYVFKKRPAP